MKRLLLGSRSDEVAIRVAQKSHPRVKKRGRGANFGIPVDTHRNVKIGSELRILDSEFRKKTTRCLL